MTLNRTAAFLVCIGMTTSLLAEQLTPAELKFFETKIRPVLVRECYGCHSNQAGNVRGGLRLDSKELMLIGGSTGPAIVPGKPDESWLFNAIMHEDFVMPPKRKLSQNEIDDFRQWIEMGAPDPRVNDVADIRSSISEEDIREARENFWAYQKPSKQVPPTVNNAAWPKTDVDRFVLSKLEQATIEPANDVEAAAFLRRVSFDIVGLPPSAAQLDAFSKQWAVDPDEAIAAVVDDLLASDQFGERWGRHWLDVVRYAESTGREINMTFPHAWRYRDFVIDSFNADKPFNQFVEQQIAGDLLPVKTDRQWAENLVATTFLAIGPKNLNEQNRVQFAADVVDEQIDATTRVFLGMSVACARCHDHKFDAIPQTDYYALAGVFKNTTTYFGNPPSEFGTFSGPGTRQSSSLMILPVDDPNPYDKRYSEQELAELKDEVKAKLEELNDLRRIAFRDVENGAANALRDRLRITNELALLTNKLSVVDDDGNPRSYCMGVQEERSIQDARLLVRGEIDQPAQVVERGFPQVLCSVPVKIESRSSGRLELARWIASEANPLTARVFVNRIWQHMIGQGIVASTDNFGVTGQAPSNGELLDYLAVRFMQSGWSTKSLVRDIANSRVYRMRSTFNQQYHELDPDNALVWRANVRRLDAEAIRDAMLSISGEIDLQRPRGSEVAKAGYTRVQGGVLGNPGEVIRNAVMSASRELRMMPNDRRRGFFGFAPRGNRESMIQDAVRKVQNQLDMEEAKFRSVYLPIVRDEEPRSLAVFDFADSSSIAGERETSNTANQALYMMNNGFVIQQSDAFAKRIAKEKSSLKERIDYAFVLCFGRLPTASERSAAMNFVRDFDGGADARSHAAADLALSTLCQSLFASAEFRYVD